MSHSIAGADALSLDEFPDAQTARPAWLVTLADLGLLLVGFFVLLQANQNADRHAIARALRSSFGGTAAADAPTPMPLAAAAVDGFAPGSASLPGEPADVIAWAREMSGDNRTVLTVTGGVDGSAADTDPETGNGAVLAADRARAVAAMLARAVPGIRLAIATPADADQSRARRVRISLGFAGERQGLAARQRDIAGKQH